MQELIEYLEKVYYVKEIIDWDEYKKELLEKEKEQIMSAVGLKKSTKKDIFGNNRIITLTPEEYYNQKYNQNK